MKVVFIVTDLFALLYFHTGASHATA